MANTVFLDHADALTCYQHWPSPILIISDGPYGLPGYKGEPHRPDGLADWYGPHIKAWSASSTAQTTLWFWSTEIGWAFVHPILHDNGWVYRCACIWDKGLSHAAGNTNTNTLRKFPVVTEICVHYVRQVEFQRKPSENQTTQITLQDWLRSEWQRTGLPWSTANIACEVRNAATRKYLSADHLWYPPPPTVFSKLAAYANHYGDPAGRPYFALAGPMSKTDNWSQLRAKFKCPLGITNVWHEPAVHGSERIKLNGQNAHHNQKPLRLIRLLVESCSDPGDPVWEPFGGLCTTALAASELGRIAYAAEIDVNTFALAQDRLGKIRCRSALLNQPSR